MWMLDICSTIDKILKSCLYKVLLEAECPSVLEVYSHHGTCRLMKTNQLSRVNVVYEPGVGPERVNVDTEFN